MAVAADIPSAVAALSELGIELPAASRHIDIIDALDGAIRELSAAVMTRAPGASQRRDWQRLAELHELRHSIGNAHLRYRLLVFSRIQAALARLRDLDSADLMIRRLPGEVARACDIDRVSIFRVEGDMMVSEAFYIEGDPARAAELFEFTRANPIQLEQQILERQMLELRRPVLVRDAHNDPATYKPMINYLETYAYVAAPIMPEGRVIGFLHADQCVRHPQDPNGVDEFDRDALWAFAEGFGHALERMQLLERMRAQGREVRRLIAQTESVVAEHLAAQVELVTGSRGASGVESAAAALVPGRPGPVWSLTPREHEVLTLIAEGQTNSQIAGRLVITESTAKSHVKRILRKLGASNRVEAASMYLRAQGLR